MALTRKNLDDKFRELVDDPRDATTYNGDRWSLAQFTLLLNDAMRMLAETLPPGALESLSKRSNPGTKDANNNWYDYPSDCAQVHSVLVDADGLGGSVVGDRDIWGMYLSPDVFDGIAEAHPDFVSCETVDGTTKIVQLFWTAWGDEVMLSVPDGTVSIPANKVTIHYIMYPTAFGDGADAAGDAETTNMTDNLLWLAVKIAARDALTKDDDPDLKARLADEVEFEIDRIRSKFKPDVRDPSYTMQGVGIS